MIYILNFKELIDPLLDDFENEFIQLADKNNIPINSY